MPYSSIEEAEKKNPGLGKYSEKAKRGWLSSFNSCMGNGGDESKCFAIAYSVANKVVKKASDDRIVATELMGVASELAAIEPRIAMSLIEEAKAIKLKAKAMEFFQHVKDFKGDINDFLREMTSAVRNPRALQAFPEIRDVIELSETINHGVLRHAFLSEQDVAQRMQKVVELDA